MLILLKKSCSCFCGNIWMRLQIRSQMDVSNAFGPIAMLISLKKPAHPQTPPNGPYPDTTVHSEGAWYLFVLMMRMRKILLKSKILTSINEKGKKGEGRDILVKYFGFYNYKYNTHQY